MLNWTLSIRLWLGKHLYGDLGSPKCTRVSRRRLIKGPTGAAEAEALHFVVENTSIRISKLYGIYKQKNGLYLEMEYVAGPTAGEIWLNTASKEKRENIMKQLIDGVEELRS
jgi:hypothetical protein